MLAAMFHSKLGANSRRGEAAGFVNAAAAAVESARGHILCMRSCRGELIYAEC
jgi:hypothetical protein